MDFLNRRWRVSLVLFAATAIPVRLAAQEQKTERPRYAITDLGTLGGTFSEAVGVNNRGAVSGYSTLPGDSLIHGFFWQKGVMTDLGTLGGPNSFAPEEWAPNDKGQVAGLSDTAALDPDAENFCGPFSFLTSDPYICLPFVWRDGLMTALPTLGGNNGAALSINNRGQVTGVSETGTATDCVPHYEAVTWRSKKGEIQVLPPLPGDSEAVADGINDGGEVVGTSGNCTSGPVEAVLWRDSMPINLGSLGGAVFNIAFGINNRGQVVGQSDLPGDTAHHAFLWQNGVMTDLGTILGLPVSLAASINNEGQVVGFSQDLNSNNTVAWLWQKGTMTDLNTLISADSPWFLIEALGINDRGQIAGHAFNNTTGEVHGFLATPDDGEADSEIALAARGETSQRREIILPENVRKMLRQRMAQRYPYRGFGLWPLKSLPRETFAPAPPLAPWRAKQSGSIPRTRLQEPERRLLIKEKLWHEEH
jgi:probable HAF family extracellular repeat protein